MFQTLKKNLITGLVILLPIAVTIALLSFLINLFTAPFVDLVSSFLRKFQISSSDFFFLSSEQLIRYTSKLLVLCALFFITVLLGMLTRWFVIHSLLSLMDKILKKIPVINTVYKASQEITKSFFKNEQTTFKQVVMIPFPSKETYVIGLVSNKAPQKCNTLTGVDLITVLVPTAPTPTSGFLVLVDQKDLIYLDMKTEEALKYVISLGLLTPRRDNNQ